MKWTAAQALDLSYCVSTDFGANHGLVRDTLAAAAQEWMDATKIAASDAPTVQFKYLSKYDTNSTCHVSRKNHEKPTLHSPLCRCVLDLE